MKAFERIFLYSVLAILVFYVFLVDDNVESKVAIQEAIRARIITIVNDEGRDVVILWTNKDGDGLISVINKDGAPVVYMGADEDGGVIGVGNKDGIRVVGMGAYKDDGIIRVYSKQGDVSGSLP